MDKLKTLYRHTKAIFVKPPYPTKVVFNCTDHCNSRCINCNVWNMPDTPTKEMLTPTEIYTFFSDPYLSYVDCVLISGGECTTRKDLYELTMSIYRALPKAAITLSTNGLLPEKMITVVTRLLREGVNLSVGVSVDRANTKNDEIRGISGSWVNACILLLELRALKIQYPNFFVGIGVVLTDENADDIKEIAEFSRRNQIPYILQWKNRAPFYGNEGEKEARIKEKRVVEELPDEFYNLKHLWLDELNGRKISYKCSAMKNFFMVKCNGDVVPCLNKWNEVAGNIRRNNIQQMLNGVTCDNCCVNMWGTSWSFDYYPKPFFTYYLSRPLTAIKRLLW